MLDGTVHFAPILFLLHRLSLVVHLFTTTEGNVYLGPAILINEYQRGYDSVAGLFLGFLKFLDFVAREQQFALALSLMIGIRAIEVGRDVHTLHPHLAVDDVAISVHERCLAGTYRLDFGAGEHNTRRELLDEKVFERGFLVLDLYRALLAKFQFLLVHLVVSVCVCLRALHPARSAGLVGLNSCEAFQMVVNVGCYLLRPFLFVLHERVVELVEVWMRLEQCHELIVGAVAFQFLAIYII